MGSGFVGNASVRLPMSLGLENIPEVMKNAE
jgi:hypothetical protein